MFDLFWIYIHRINEEKYQAQFNSTHIFCYSLSSDVKSDDDFHDKYKMSEMITDRLYHRHVVY